MNRGKAAITVFVLLCAACTAHALYYYTQLPERVAMHFGESGQPNGWGSKTELIAVYLATVFFSAAIFLSSGLVIKKMPNWAISLPNKDYWLAPENRQETLNYLLPQMLWLGSLTMIFLLDIFHQTIQVNMGAAAVLDHGMVSVAAYLVLTTAWCIALFRKFSKSNFSRTGNDSSPA